MAAKLFYLKYRQSKNNKDNPPNKTSNKLHLKILYETKKRQTIQRTFNTLRITRCIFPPRAGVARPVSWLALHRASAAFPEHSPVALHVRAMALCAYSYGVVADSHRASRHLAVSG